MTTTVLDTTAIPTPAPAQTPGPSRAIAAYRESVFAGQQPTDEVLFAARKILAEWRADRARYERRVEACRVLNEEIPRLQQAAAEAERALAEAKNFARSPLPDSMMLSELRARISTANPNVATGSLTELARGLLLLCDSSSPQSQLCKLRSNIGRLEKEIGGSRQSAEETLRATVAHIADPAPSNLGAKIGQLAARIQSREPALRAESQIPAVKSQCEALARGEELSALAFGQAQGTPPTTLYRIARTRLDNLMQLAAGKEATLAADAADQAELVQLQAQLAEAGERARARLLDARTMKFVGD